MKFNPKLYIALGFLATSLLPLKLQAATFTVDSSSDANDNDLNDLVCKTSDNHCSLRAAIDQANHDAGADIIQLPAGSIQLSGTGDNNNSQGDLDITDDVTITGVGARATIIKGSGTDRVIHIISAKVTLKDLTVTHGLINDPNENGAGIWNQDGDLTVERCAITDNQILSGSAGGGIQSNGKLTVLSSTLSNNGQNNAGVGAAIAHISPNQPITIDNSTISGNRSSSSAIVGAISEVIITNSTIVLNQSTNGPGGIGAGANVSIRNSILAQNTSNLDTQDCDFNIVSQGFNLIGINDCNWNSATGDILGTLQAPLNPQLGPLQDNGGPTDTHALLVGSPAIGAGDVANCPDTDQRGVKRPDGTCDMGAFQTTKCGDGDIQGAEECDDGNLIDGDGCSAICEIEGNGPGNGSGTGDGGGCELNAQEASSPSSIFALIGFLTLGVLGLSTRCFSKKR